MRTPHIKPDPCLCKYCNRMVPLIDWSASMRKGRRVWRDRCKQCVNAYQRSLLSTPDGKARLAAQYKRRKTAGLIKALPWNQKTPEQKARAVAAVKAWRERNRWKMSPLILPTSGS